MTLKTVAVVALLALLAACGGGKGNTGSAEAADNAETAGSAASKVSYTNYVDNEKGVSFDVPEGLEKFDGPEAMGATEFRFDGKIINGVSADVSQSWDGEYTKEMIDKDFDEATLSLTGTPDSKERTADGYIITESYKEWGRNGMQKVVYKGDKKYNITVYWDDEYVDEYGGDVAKHVIESFKVNE